MILILSGSLSEFLFEYGFLMLGSVIAISEARNSYLEKKEENIDEVKSNLRNRRSYHIIIVGLVISLLGGVCNNIQQDKDKSDAKTEANDNKRRADSLNTALIKTQDSLQKKSDLIIGLSNNQLDSLENVLKATLDNRKLQQQLNIKEAAIADLEKQQNDTLKNLLATTQAINKLQSKISDLQTELYKQTVNQPEDSPKIECVSVFEGPDGNKIIDYYLIYVYLYNDGSYPIHNLRVQITEYFDTKKARLGDTSGRKTTFLPVTIISPTEKNLLYRIEIPKEQQYFHAAFEVKWSPNRFYSDNYQFVPTKDSMYLRTVDITRMSKEGLASYPLQR